MYGQYVGKYALQNLVTCFTVRSPTGAMIEIAGWEIERRTDVFIITRMNTALSTTRPRVKLGAANMVLYYVTMVFRDRTPPWP